MAALLFFEMMFTYARPQVKCQLYRRVRDIHLPYIRYAIPRLGACREIGYACSVSPTSQRMDLARRVHSGGLFFGHFLTARRKNPRSMPMRVSLSCLVPSARSGFCAQIMRANAGFIDLRCHIGLATQPLLGHLQQADRPLNRGRRKQSPY